MLTKTPLKSLTQDRAKPPAAASKTGLPVPVRTPKKELLKESHDAQEIVTEEESVSSRLSIKNRIERLVRCIPNPY